MIRAKRPHVPLECLSEVRASFAEKALAAIEHLPLRTTLHFTLNFREY